MRNRRTRSTLRAAGQHAHVEQPIVGAGVREHREARSRTPATLPTNATAGAGEDAAAVDGHADWRIRYTPARASAAGRRSWRNRSGPGACGPAREPHGHRTRRPPSAGTAGRWPGRRRAGTTRRRAMASLTSSSKLRVVASGCRGVGPSGWPCPAGRSAAGCGPSMDIRRIEPEEQVLSDGPERSVAADDDRRPRRAGRAARRSRSWGRSV